METQKEWPKEFANELGISSRFSTNIKGESLWRNLSMDSLFVPLLKFNCWKPKYTHPIENAGFMHL
jgi:hypothetical protein